MPTVWRIVKTKYAADAFDGEGARLYGGRWNSPGVRMVYTAQSVSLAMLEMLVHLNSSSLLASYSLCAAHIDDSLIVSLDRTALPGNWRTYPAPSPLQRIGDDWVAGGASAVLEVPSVIVERESNYLLNPEHRDFGAIVVDAPEPFRFDARLLAE